MEEYIGPIHGDNVKAFRRHLDKWYIDKYDRGLKDWELEQLCKDTIKELKKRARAYSKKCNTVIEVEFEGDVSNDQTELLQDALCKHAGLDSRRMGEFGTGYSVIDIFPEEAKEVAKKFKNLIGKKVRGVKITNVIMSDRA